MKETEIEKSLFKRLKAWYGVAPYIWNCLLIGLLLLLAAIVLWFFFDFGDPAAGGALMVGVGIVAQVHFSRLPLRVVFNSDDETSLRSKHLYKDKPGIKQISAQTERAQSHLWKLANKSDFVIESFANPENKILILDLVIYRVDKRLEIAIGCYALIGTLIWGYGGEVFKLVACYRSL